MDCNNDNYDNVYYKEISLSSYTKRGIITEIFETLKKHQLSPNQVDDILDCVKAGMRNRIFN